MKVGVLGPLTVETEGVSLTIGSAKERAVLSLLALRATNVVSLRELSEALWGEHQPRSADKTIQTYVSNLRRRLPGGAISTVGRGYRLVVGAEAVDARRFEALLSQARRSRGHQGPGRAIHVLNEALALWRGEPLADLADTPLGLSEATRLCELRQSVEEDLAEARLAHGDHQSMVASLETAVAAEPLRERRWAQLMLSLYRCGRQADALRTYQRLRQLLGNELGIEPSAELVALEEAILLQKPELDCERDAAAHAGGTLALPARLAGGRGYPFVGRGAELNALSRALDAATTTGVGQMMLVAGSAGMGKTTLVRRAAQLAHSAGTAVFYARCREDVTVPYQPFVEGLDQFAASAPEHWLDGFDQAQLAQLTHLSGVLMRRLPHLSPARLADPDAERHLLFEAFAGLLAELSHRLPVLVIVDDLQWADPPSLQLLRHVADGLVGPVLMVGCYRHDQVDSGDPLVRTLGELRRQLVIDDVQLSGFSESEIEAIMEAIAGHPLGGDTAKLARLLRSETDGNPFFVAELVRHLVDTRVIVPTTGGEWMARAVGHLDLPESVRQVVGARAARLTRATRDVLSTAAIIGQDFDLDLLARCVGSPATRERPGEREQPSRVSDLTEGSLLDHLQVAQRATLVAEDDTPGRFRFVHALIRQTMYESLGATRRTALHRQVARQLEATFDDVPVERAAELAHHYMAGGCKDDIGGVARYSRLAGDHALSALAPSDASAYYNEALAALENGADEHERARCLIGLGDAQRQQGRSESGHTLLVGARLARDLGDSSLLVQAALANYRGIPNSPGIVDAEWVQVLQAALEAESNDTPERCRLLATLALEYGYEPDYTRRLGLVDEAVAVARRIGDRAVILDALARPSQIGLVPELADDFRQRNAEAVALAEHGGDPIMRFSAHRARASLLVEHGQIDGVDESLSIMGEIAETLDQPLMRWIHLIYRSWRLFLRGNIDSAERVADEALNLGLGSTQPDALLAYSVTIFTIRQHQGRAGELMPMMDQAANEFPEIQGIRSGLAVAAVQAEEQARARELLQAAWQSGFLLPKDVSWLSSATCWAEVAADLHEDRPAHVLYRLLEPWHDRVPIGGAAVSHCVAHTLGRLASLLGHHDDAVRYFSEALTIHERLGAPHFAHRTRLALAGIGRASYPSVGDEPSPIPS